MGLASTWNQKARMWIKGRENIFDSIKNEIGSKPKSGPTIWMHCASLGEFEQGRPLLEKIRQNHPSARLIVSFFSPSGYEVRKNYQGADHIFYLPLDGPSNAKNFIDLINPNLVLWIKYEFWYHYLKQLNQRNIPVLLVSGIFRPGQAFFKSYGGFMRNMLGYFSHFFVQNGESDSLLKTLGLGEKVTISGDTRFDRVIAIAERFTPVPAVEKFCEGHKVIVAGSTWTEDEEEWTHYVRTHPEIRFIIAPHEIEEDNIKSLKKEFKNYILYSELIAEETNADNGRNVLIIDNIGLLAKLYRYADITYVGGGFGDDGIHNILEAAVYGKLVIFGPVFDKYFEAEEMLDEGGAITIDSALQLEAELNRLWENESEIKSSGEAARNYVYSKAGATNFILDYIQRNRLLTI
ncbi:MAG: 3-deoxy-D-manno-octulosonic acid transferase [Bacteroidetes bacterium]|nr:MAG: 3-deoxy-D-manno-octulosonic acid transferase [Bacteroidota bacterium]